MVPELHDSYGGVFYTDQQLAQLFKRRCGVGVDISNLRPSGAKVSNAAGSTLYQYMNNKLVISNTNDILPEIQTILSPSSIQV